MNLKYGLIFAQNAKSVSGCSSTRHEHCKIESRAAGTLIARHPAAPEWKKIYQTATQELRLLYQARVLSWGKEKSYYYGHHHSA